MKFEELDGDLIKLAKEGKFDVIVHGCNCFCTMGAGLAPQMAKAFGVDRLPLEQKIKSGDINKLGLIEWANLYVKDGEVTITPAQTAHKLKVVNCYSQYDMTGRRQGEMDLDYNALTLCFKKMNHVFKGKHIGLPEIGCHLGGGSWVVVKELIRNSFLDCDVTVVHYQK